MSTASEWSSVILGGVQFAAGIAVAYYTLRKQHNESIAQRDGAWFHLVVADKTIAALHDLLEGESVQLNSSAERCTLIKLGGADQATIDARFRDELRSFKDRLAPIRRRVSNFAFIFDRELYKTVSKQFQDLEDEVANWFDRLQSQGPVDRREALMDVVCDCQRKLLQSFRDYEFVTLPSRQNGDRKKIPRNQLYAIGIGLLVSALSMTCRLLHASLHTMSDGKQVVLYLDYVPAWISGIVVWGCSAWLIAKLIRPALPLSYVTT